MLGRKTFKAAQQVVRASALTLSCVRCRLKACHDREQVEALTLELEVLSPFQVGWLLALC